MNKINKRKFSIKGTLPTDSEKEIAAQITRALNTIKDDSSRAHSSRDYSRKQECELRRKLAKSIEGEFRTRDENWRTVFVSFTNTGVPIMKRLVNIAVRCGFRVITWDQEFSQRIEGEASPKTYNTIYDEKEPIEPDILKRIKQRIENANSFFGIWSNNFKVTELAAKDISGNDRLPLDGFGPGVWPILETGFALQSGRPFILIREIGCHPSYYERVFGHDEIAQYDPKDWDKCDKIIENGLKALMDKINLKRIG